MGHRPMADGPSANGRWAIGQWPMGHRPPPPKKVLMRADLQKMRFPFFGDYIFYKKYIKSCFWAKNWLTTLFFKGDFEPRFEFLAKSYVEPTSRFLKSCFLRPDGKNSVFVLVYNLIMTRVSLFVPFQELAVGWRFASMSTYICVALLLDFLLSSCYLWWILFASWSLV